MADTTTPTPETIAKADYDKAVERAQRFEGMTRDLEVRLQEFKDIDPKAYKALKEDYDNLKKDAALGDPKKFDSELQRREAEIRNTIEKDLNTLRDQVTKLASRNKELEVTDKVFALSSGELFPTAHDDFKEYIRRFGDKDEAGNIIFKDEQGNARYKKGSTTQLMGPADFVEFMKETKPHLFKATSRAGVGVNGTVISSNGNSNGLDVERYKNMSSAERKALPIDIQQKFAVELLNMDQARRN